MNKVIRMKDTPGTAAALLHAARRLFARHGYDGTSVRAITRAANANLGAITYHFGSKRELYETVIAAAMAPSRERLARAAQAPGTALDRVETVVREFFAFLHDTPDLPSLMMQQLIGERPLAKATLDTVEANIGTLAALIAEGQHEGTIRPGDPRLMALSIGSQPIWLTAARRALREGASIDPADPATRGELVDSVVGFVRAGLVAHSEKA